MSRDYRLFARTVTQPIPRAPAIRQRSKRYDRFFSAKQRRWAVHRFAAGASKRCRPLCMDCAYGPRGGGVLHRKDGSAKDDSRSICNGFGSFTSIVLRATFPDPRAAKVDPMVSLR